VTLRRDLEQILAVIEPTNDEFEVLLNDEHARHRGYLAALSVVADTRDGEIVALILRDPDRVMAESAVVAHIDHRASQLAAKDPATATAADAFAAWAATLADVVDPSSFVARRIREWQLFIQVMNGETVDPVALANSSNWLQRKVVEEAGSVAALTVMGEAGRTKRVRNLAKTKAGRVSRASLS